MSENALTPGSAVWKYIRDSVPSQLGAAGHLAQSVAQPFTNLFGNGGQEFWNGPQDPQAAHDMSNALLTMYAGNAFNPAATVENGLGAGIKAFHGSPYDFDKFDAAKIGTGEGAQAYGHGLYFAENEGVAKSYRDSQVPPGTNRTKKLNWFPPDSGKIVERNPDYAPGKMYEVNINADPASFLHNDARLTNQPQPVREALGKFSEHLPELNFSDSTLEGRDAYEKLVDRMSSDPNRMKREAFATEALRQAGIPGIRYLDQGSRAAGEGSHNYVVFPGNEHLIEIVKKYGIAGAATMLGLSQSDLHSAVFGNDQQPTNALAR